MWGTCYHVGKVTKKKKEVAITTYLEGHFHVQTGVIRVRSQGGTEMLHSFLESSRWRHLPLTTIFSATRRAETFPSVNNSSRLLESGRLEK